MVAQDDGRSADANMPRLATLQFQGDFFNVGKKRVNELVKLLAIGCQREGPAGEKGHAQMLFQLRDLTANGWLLDAIRDVAHRLHDSSVARDVIEQLQVVDVHVLNFSSTAS